LRRWREHDVCFRSCNLQRSIITRPRPAAPSSGSGQQRTNPGSNDPLSPYLVER
jgi:hypothetical protein